MKAADVRSLEGRVLLVGGAVGGLGRQLARALTAEGARVGGTGSDQVELMRLQEEIDLALTLLPGDLRSAEVAVRAMLDRHGRLDGVVHCPAEARPVPWREATLRRLGERLEESVLPMAALDRAALPLLQEQRQGCIVHVLIKDGGGAIETAARAAARGWSEGLAAELKGTRIRVETASIPHGRASLDGPPDPRVVEAVVQQVRQALLRPPDLLHRLRRRLRRQL